MQMFYLLQDGGLAGQKGKLIAADVTHQGLRKFPPYGCPQIGNQAVPLFPPMNCIVHLKIGEI